MPLRSQDPLLLHGEQVQTVSTASEEAGAMFRDALQSGPMGSLSRMADLEEAEDGVRDSAFMLAKTGMRTGSGPTSAKLSQADALFKIKEAGLDTHLEVPVSGMRQRTLDILIERKREELKRQTILQQSPGGAGRMTGRIASAFAGSLVDPTNVLLAFVPVIGEARYASLLARAGTVGGRTMVRTGVGAVEGVVGAAIAEPFNYMANVQQQADYDAYDSMLNIASGAAFGSALHSGAGLFGDMMRPGRYATRQRPVVQQPDPLAGQAIARSDVVPPVERSTEIDPAAAGVLREKSMVLDRLAEGRPLTRDHAVATAVDRLRTEIEADLLARASGVADAGVVAAARTDLSTVTRELDGLEGERRQIIKDINQRPGVTRKQAESLADAQLADRRADLDGRKARAQSQIDANKSAVTAVEELSALKRGEVPDAFRARIDEEADRLLGSTGENPLSAAVRKAIDDDPFQGIRPFMAQLPGEVQQTAFRMAMAQALTGRPIDVSPAMLAHYGDMQGAAGAATRNAAEVAGADHFAADAATMRLREAKVDTIDAVKEAANDSETQWREQATEAGLTPEEIADVIDEGAQAVADAGRYVKALKIAALCAMRAG